MAQKNPSSKPQRGGSSGKGQKSRNRPQGGGDRNEGQNRRQQNPR
jgi:hypothetical protein